MGNNAKKDSISKLAAKISNAKDMETLWAGGACVFDGRSVAFGANGWYCRDDWEYVYECNC